MSNKKWLIILIILVLQSCKSSKQIELKNHDVDLLKSHLKEVSEASELFKNYNGIYYGNKKYSVSDYFLSNSELKESQQNKALAKLEVGDILGPIPNKEGKCSLFKKEANKIYFTSKHRYIYIPNEENYHPLRKPLIKKEELLKLIKEGRDFGELAKEHSKDPYTNQNYGLTDWVMEGFFLPEFEKKSKEVEPFEIYEIENERGLFILRVEKKWKKRELTKIIEIKIKNCS